MAVPWTAGQRPRVGRILRECPVESGRCSNAARRILPVARETDADAQPWALRPTEGRWLVAKHPGARGWRFHVTTQTEAHCVDALTGVDGTSIDLYLEEHWLERDAIGWVADPDLEVYR